MKIGLIISFCLAALVCVTVHICHKNKSTEPVWLPEVSYSTNNIQETEKVSEDKKESTRTETNFEIRVDLNQIYNIIKLPLKVEVRD